MSQTRLGSFIEACINVLIGFWINFAANLLILPLMVQQDDCSRCTTIGA